MPDIDNSLIMEQTLLIEEDLANGMKSPLLFESFLNKTIDRSIRKSNVYEFPTEIRIPKNDDALKKQDYEPAQIIKLEKPILDSTGRPIWYKSSHHGIDLGGFGYVNGDNRYLSDVAFNTKTIHMFIVGVTGHGKSVVINSTNADIMKAYAPWEVKFVMADGKITEFLKYISKHNPPHVAAVAATSDAEYMISVLEYYIGVMRTRMAIFGAAGQSNIEGFREVTGLTLPRLVIVVDELTEALKNAKRKRDYLEGLLGTAASQGRSAGVHIMLCSQTPDGVSGTTLSNINIRASLGAQAEVSQKVLGNTEAMINFGSPGKLIVNTNHVSGNKADNIHFRVPFPSDDYMQDVLGELDKIADEVGFRWDLESYSEAFYMDLNEFQHKLEDTAVNPHKWLLGEPSFLSDDPDPSRLLPLEFSGDDTENVLIYTGTSKDRDRFIKMILANIKAMKDKPIYYVFAPNERVRNDLDLDPDDPHLFFNVIKSFDNKKLQEKLFLVYCLRLAIEADSGVFSGDYGTTRLADKAMGRAFGENAPEYTELNRKRANALITLVAESADYQMWFPQSAPSTNEDKYEEGIAALCKMMISDFYYPIGAVDSQLTRNNLTPKYIFLVDIDRMNGLGRLPSGQQKKILMSLLMDCYEANFRVIVTMTDTGEFVSNPPITKSGFRYYLASNVSPSKAETAGMKEYPEQVHDILAVMFDRDRTPAECVKFKKVAFVDEIL